MLRPAARLRTAVAAALIALGATLLTPPAAAAGAADPVPLPIADYCGSQCSDILPPGQSGNATLAQILLHKAFGTLPAHTSDQLARYEALVAGYPGLTDAKVNDFFGRPVADPPSRVHCGGSLAACREAVTAMLKQAAAATSAAVYPADGTCAAGNQWCADSIVQRPVGGLSHPQVNWQNRPTYQQVVEFPAHR
ncbi:hypothetical protein ACFXKW_13030 [Streptomyces sp. NPDC059193]|uniref:hypothetical protein n=1 Tax=Streptomyces sp. NPDC059193 TaxID=3346763 RepID=UPI0036A33F9A